MSGQWKPGDVGSHPTCGIGLVVEGGSVICDHACSDAPHWHTQSGSWNDLDGDYRRLVVIDPDDAEQIERLAQAYISANPSVAAIPTLITARLTAALRAFAAPTPPRPDEPQGLGAVVEDAEGISFVRTNVGGWEWHEAGGGPTSWNMITAVRVISEGVATA